VDVEPLKPEERIVLACLLGLTSRDRLRIWLLHEPLDRTWLDWHKKKGHIAGYPIPQVVRQDPRSCAHGGWRLRGARG
jgi:hypothetical protein